ncbi:MAG: 6-hydroxymethylpterin diphosphokinase MptE-like protein [Pseudodesulfovibrio sp.]
MENGKTAALEEIGVLIRGGAGPACGDGAPDPGPHAYSGHNQLCRYQNPRFQYPYENPAIPAYQVFAPGMPLGEALDRTRLIVFIGAADSPEFRAAMARPETRVLLCEFDVRALDAFLEDLPTSLLGRPHFHILAGDPSALLPPLQDRLPASLFKAGTPAVYLTDRVRRDHRDRTDRLIEYLEILHYRHVIYVVSGQHLARSRPIRNIERGLFFDQQAHAFDNAADCLRSPEVGRLRNVLRGHTAILAAAGPDLNGRMEYIRANRSRAVVIAVNNAVKPLAEAGIKPHMVVINDVTFAAGEVFRHIPPLPGTILVAHCLSDLGGDRFRRKFLFGNHREEIFGTREDLPMHGSVISTAFSLARLLGCARAVLVGAQLCSDNPWGLAYARGTVKAAPAVNGEPLPGRFPQLYPAATPFGETVYTTLNFRDAALWLSETVRASGMACVNTSRQSLLYGPGIEFDDAPGLPPADVNAPFAALFRIAPPRPDHGLALHYLRREAELWANIRAAAQGVLAETGPNFLVKGMEALVRMDAGNVTYLAHRFGDFDNEDFHRRCHGHDGPEREHALRGYFGHVLAMSADLLDRLDRARGACREQALDSGRD